MKASWCRNEMQEDLAGRKRVVRERERKNLHSLCPSLCWAQPISSLVRSHNGISKSNGELGQGRDCLKTSSFDRQDFDVRLWHIPSRQCVRTLGHKGAVGIVKFFAPVAGIFDTDNFKASVVLSAFDKNVLTSSPDESYVLQVSHHESIP